MKNKSSWVKSNIIYVAYSLNFILVIFSLNFGKQEIISTSNLNFKKMEILQIRITEKKK